MTNVDRRVDINAKKQHFVLTFAVKRASIKNYKCNVKPPVSKILKLKAEALRH